MKNNSRIIAAILALILALAATGCSTEDSAQTIDNATTSTSSSIEENYRLTPPPSEKEKAEPAVDEAEAEETTGEESSETEQPESFINQQQIEGGIVTNPPSSPTQPTTPTPPSNPTPPSLVHEGELNEVIDYGVYCGTCGSLWDMEHNTCPNCFPYEG